MNKVVVALAAILTLPSIASAAPCRGAKGKFIKCPPTATATHAVAAHAAATAHKAPCRDARGRFKKC